MKIKVSMTDEVRNLLRTLPTGYSLAFRQCYEQLERNGKLPGELQLSRGLSFFTNTGGDGVAFGLYINKREEGWWRRRRVLRICIKELVPSEILSLHLIRLHSPEEQVDSSQQTQVEKQSWSEAAANIIAWAQRLVFLFQSLSRLPVLISLLLAFLFLLGEQLGFTEVLPKLNPIIQQELNQVELEPTVESYQGGSKAVED